MKTSFKRVLALTTGLMVGMMAQSGTAYGTEMEWKMTTPWGGGPWLERDAKLFADKVTELTDGRISITVFPGGTLYNPIKATEAVESGIAEVSHNWMAYDWGVDKTTALFAGYAGGMTPEGYMLWLYSGGGLELWEEYRKEKFGVVSFPCAIIGTEIFLHSRKKVESLEDFKGLKIRTSGAWAEIASRLGASTVVLPGAEVYSALERGVIDATEWGSPEINQPTGFKDIAQYVVVPGIHQPGGVLECQVNDKVWSELSDKDRELVKLAGKLTVYESWLKSSSADLNAFKELEDGPNEILTLNDDFVAKVHEVTKAWEDEQAANNAWFKKVLTSMRTFKAQLQSWEKYRLPIGSLDN